MRLFTKFWFFFAAIPFVSSSQSASGADEAAARTAAAQANLAFYTVCLADINTNLGSYNSYMEENNMQLPQTIADYYFHIAALPSTADLQADIARSFPFTQFQTFITNFPWYESLMQKASITTVYLPQDFLSTQTAGGGSQTMASQIATNTGQTKANPDSLSTQNVAGGIDVSIFYLFLVFFGIFVL